MTKDENLQELIKLINEELLKGKNPTEIRQHLSYVGFDSVDISRAMSTITNKVSTADLVKGGGGWLLTHWWLLLLALGAGAIMKFRSDFSIKEYSIIGGAYLLMAFVDMIVVYFILLAIKPDRTPSKTVLFLASLLFSIIGGIFLPLYPAGIMFTFLLMGVSLFLFFGLEVPLASLCAIALIVIHGMAVFLIYLFLNNPGLFTGI